MNILSVGRNQWPLFDVIGQFSFQQPPFPPSLPTRFMKKLFARRTQLFSLIKMFSTDLQQISIFPPDFDLILFEKAPNINILRGISVRSTACH